MDDFIRIREKDWQRLSQLIDRQVGRSGLSADEVRELGRLYRAVTSDLALARRDFPNQRVTLYLNQLLTRTHSVIYQQNVTDLRPIAHYFTQTLPRIFRETAVFTLIAFLLFLIPAVIAFRLMDVNPQNAAAFGLEDQRRILSEHSTWTDIPEAERPFESGFIMTNNIKVALLAFGGGIVFGLFSLYVLVGNGLSVGAVLGLAVHYGMGKSLFQFMVAHGVIELSVIFMAGGAGLQMGWALLNPGPFTRGDALRLAAQRAMLLILSGVPLLMIAGTIEGLFSPSNAPFEAHVLVGVVTGIVLYSYLLLAGRSRLPS
jgi:uncharacterized membrane protein SpoIIM required for sporulation